MARKDRPQIHGVDHANGVDPIPGHNDALTLYSSKSQAGDPSAAYTIPAYAGGIGGAVGSIPFLHAIEPADTTWYELHYLGPVVTSPPYDTVVLQPGHYMSWAYVELSDPGFDAWFGAGIVSISGAFTLPRDYDDVHQVHDTVPGTSITTGGADHGFTMHGPVWVPSATTGQVYVQVWHQDNRTVDIDPEQTLTILKLF